MADEDSTPAVSLTPELKATLVSSFRGLGQLAAETPDPALWLAKLDEVVSWLDRPEALPERLIDLIVTSKRSSLDLDDEVLQAAVAGRVSPNQRLYILLIELVCRAGQALIDLGTPARDALLRAYFATAPGSKERAWFLVSLSRTGDPELAPFFAALREEDFDADRILEPLQHFRSQFEAYRARRV